MSMGVYKSLPFIPSFSLLPDDTVVTTDDKTTWDQLASGLVCC